jgi:thioredoxin-like negative regulator of GroEL
MVAGSFIKLQPVRSMHAAERGLSRRQQELLNRLGDRDKTVARVVTVRRAISVLAQIGTADALHQLQELSKHAPNDGVKRLAAAVL